MKSKTLMLGALKSFSFSPEAASDMFLGNPSINSLCMDKNIYIYNFHKRHNQLLAYPSPFFFPFLF